MVDYIKEALKEIEPYINRTKTQKVKPKYTPNGKLPTPKTSNEVQEIQNILRTMSMQSKFNYNPKRKEDMTYLQAIKQGHKLPAMKSSDGDIMPNIIDCRPFDKKKQTDMYEDEDWYYPQKSENDNIQTKYILLIEGADGNIVEEKEIEGYPNILKDYSIFDVEEKGKNQIVYIYKD